MKRWNSQSDPRADRQPAPLSHKVRSYRLHVLLVVVLGIECAAAAALHRTDQQLRQDLKSGDASQKVHALFLLTNRGHPRPLSPRYVRKLLTSDEPLVREWTMTANFTRLGHPDSQSQFLESLDPSPARTRCHFLFFGRPANPWRMTLSDVAAFVDAIEE